MKIFEVIPLTVNFWPLIPQIFMWSASFYFGYLGYKLGLAILKRKKR